jgi:hypothetical protein
VSAKISTEQGKAVCGGCSGNFTYDRRVNDCRMKLQPRAASRITGAYSRKRLQDNLCLLVMSTDPSQDRPLRSVMVRG